jgi:signal transduction histidine kinase
MRWQTFANVAGISVALSMIAASAVLVWWLRTRALRPVLELSDALARFGGGDRRCGRPRRVRGGRAHGAQLQPHGGRARTSAAGAGAFLASVAHDLRNPISALKLTTAAFPPGAPLPSEVRLRRALEVVRRQAGKLERMLNDLLDTARIEAGEVEMRVERLDLRDLVRSALELFEGSSPQHRLVSEVPEFAVPVYCDPLRIEQVLANLVSNAIKYSPAGGEVRATLRTANGEAVIQVTDQGIGIPERDRATIFEPFRRTGSLRSAVAGTGLGLYVVRRLVEAHAGSVAVGSMEGGDDLHRPATARARRAAARDRERAGRARVAVRATTDAAGELASRSRHYGAGTMKTPFRSSVWEMYSVTSTMLPGGLQVPFTDFTLNW